LHAIPGGKWTRNAQSCHFQVKMLRVNIKFSSLSFDQIHDLLPAVRACTTQIAAEDPAGEFFADVRQLCGAVPSAAQWAGAGRAAKEQLLNDMCSRFITAVLSGAAPEMALDLAETAECDMAEENLPDLSKCAMGFILSMLIASNVIQDD
jgi:hypothetical protein